MAGRVLDVTSYTTLEYVEASLLGPDWEGEGVGVLDVTTPNDDPDAVVVEFELDPTATEAVAPHADRMRLTREQARDLQAALEEEIESDGGSRPRRLQG